MNPVNRAGAVSEISPLLGCESSCPPLLPPRVAKRHSGRELRRTAARPLYTYLMSSCEKPGWPGYQDLGFPTGAGSVA